MATFTYTVSIVIKWFRLKTLDVQAQHVRTNLDMLAKRRTGQQRIWRLAEVTIILNVRNKNKHLREQVYMKRIEERVQGLSDRKNYVERKTTNFYKSTRSCFRSLKCLRAANHGNVKNSNSREQMTIVPLQCVREHNMDMTKLIIPLKTISHDYCRYNYAPRHR